MTVSRRTLAKGAAWAAPVIAVAAVGPAYAASSGKLDLTFTTRGNCKGPGSDVYTRVNLVNNTSQPITLKSALVLLVQLSNPDRNHVAASSDVGVQSCRETDSSLTLCGNVLWTIPQGTVIDAGATIDMAWHLLLHLRYPTHFIVSQVSGPNVVNNPSTTSAAQGYTGGNGCISHQDF